MSTNFNLSFLDPSLRQAILNKLNGIKQEDEELTDKEIQDIAEQVINNECDKNSNKLNMDKFLSSLENRLYFDAEKTPNRKLEEKGVIDAVGWSFDYDLINGLYFHGIVGANSKGGVLKDENGNPALMDIDQASKLVGKEVNNWDEFYAALLDNSYSYEEDISQSISKDYLYTLLDYNWLLGPIYEYKTKEDYDEDNVTGERYVLNNLKIEHDFAQYIEEGNKIETIEDLVKAMDWLTYNNHAVNGEIDDVVYQGGTGDCWLLSAVLSLNSSDAGKQVISDAMQINSDGSITVTFKGVKTADGEPIQYTITADEIQKHDTDYNSYDPYSNGDNDMLIMELAVEKLEKDIYDQRHHGKNSLEKEIILPNTPEITDTVPGENIYDENKNIIGRDYIKGGFPERLLYFLTGNGSQVINPEGYDEIMNQLYEEGVDSYFDPLIGQTDEVALSGLSMNQINELFESLDDEPKALTFGLYPDPDTLDMDTDGNYMVYYTEDGTPCVATTRELTDIYGKSFVLQLPFTHVVFDDNDNPKLDENGNLQFTKASAADAYAGHALVITNVNTEDRTVTIVNPWDSTDEYTFTWEQFQQMGIGSMTATNINSSNPEDNVDNSDIVSGSDNVNPSERAITTDGTGLLDPLSFSSLDELKQAIRDKTVNLRETSCDGVFCQLRNPDKKPGDYTEQKHYVWNDAKNCLEEIPGVYYIRPDGTDRYGQPIRNAALQATLQRYNFTTEDGVFEKNGELFVYDADSNQFVPKSNGASSQEINQSENKKNSAEQNLQTPDTNAVKYSYPGEGHNAINSIIKKYNDTLNQYYKEQTGLDNYNSAFSTIIGKAHESIDVTKPFSEKDVIDTVKKIIDDIADNKAESEKANAAKINNVKNAVNGILTAVNGGAYMALGSLVSNFKDDVKISVTLQDGKYVVNVKYEAGGVDKTASVKANDSTKQYLTSIGLLEADVVNDKSGNTAQKTTPHLFININKPSREV